MKKEDIIKSLVTWEPQSLNKDSAKLAFLEAEDRLKKGGTPAEQRTDILVTLSSRMEQDIVKRGQEGQYRFNKNDSTKEERAQRDRFSNFTGSYSINQMQRAKQEEERERQAMALQQVEGQFGEVLNRIYDDPEAINESLPAVLAEKRRAMKQAGFEESEIIKGLADTEKSGLNAAYESISERDPKAGDAFLQQHAAKFGKSIVGLRRQSKHRIAKMEAAESKLLIRDAMVNMEDFDRDQLQEIAKEDSVQGNAAAKRIALMEKSPDSYAASLPQMNLANPASVMERIEKVEFKENAYFGSASRERLDLFTKKNIAKFEEMATSGLGSGRKVLDFLSMGGSAAPGDIERVASSMKGAPLGHAVRMYEHVPKLSLKIIEGMSSPRDPTVSYKELVKSGYTPIFADKAANESVLRSMEAISKLGDISSVTELKEEIANIQDTNPGFFAFERKIAVPFGFTGEEFERAGTELLDDPARLRKYANGDMMGGNKSIDYDDVEFEAVRPGIYRLRKDGKYVPNSNGGPYELNMRKALNAWRGQEEEELDLTESQRVMREGPTRAEMGENPNGQ